MNTMIYSSCEQARRCFRRFIKESEGAALVEFALAIPLLFALVAGALVMQDSIRMSYLNAKASYTLSDMVSREDEWIDSQYFIGLNNVFEYLVDGRYPIGLRITAIECTKNCTDQATRKLEVCWSESSSGYSGLDADEIDKYISHTPLFLQGDTMIITETFLDYTPMVFPSIFGPRHYEAITFTKPRIAGQIKFFAGSSDGELVFKDCFNNGAAQQSG